MPRVCTVCTNPEKEAIDTALVGGETYRYVSERFAVSVGALQRHKEDHLPATLLHAEENRERLHSINVMDDLRQCIERVALLSDACDRWLRDPEDPTRYDIGPRAEDVKVTYTESAGPARPPVRKKAPLSELLAKVEGRPGLIVEAAEVKHADPRELLLKAYDRLQGRLELVAKLLGELQQEGTTNVIVSPEWQRVRVVLLAALSPYPEARAAAAEALVEAER